MDVRSVLERLGEALRQRGIDHALIGGLALAAHGAARATADLDLLVSSEGADALHRLLTETGYECLQRTEYVANYAHPDAAQGRIDLLFARQRYGREMLERAAPHTVAGEVRVPVVDAADLIGLKVQAFSNDRTRRRVDLADIEQLLRRAPDLDMERVREYFRLFDREKELDALLEEAESR